MAVRVNKLIYCELSQTRSCFATQVLLFTSIRCVIVMPWKQLSPVNFVIADACQNMESLVQEKMDESDR